jgi:dTDP-4-dehydrorhamnose 3,5-epimerase
VGLKKISEHLNGLIVFQPDVFEDKRGFFMESYRADEFEKLGLPTDFVQDNHSRSIKGVLRGMHYQWDKPQGKLIRVTVGSCFVVEIDIRKNSPTLGKWFGIELNDQNKKMLWVPPGFANGFLTLSDWAEVQYKCTAFWNKNGESSIRWNDPKISVDWNVSDPVISEKDMNAQLLDEWLGRDESNNFEY